MSARPQDPDLGRLHLNDDNDDADGLFDSPIARSTTPKDPVPTKHATTTRAESASRPVQSAALREQTLRAELAQLKQMNTTIEGLNHSLSTAKVNLQTMQTNMDSAKTLLKTWSRILSQAEHNQRLILDPRWQGATKDVEDIENEELRRQEEVQRKIQEEQARRDEQQRKRDEAARRLEAEEHKKPRGLGKTRSTRGIGGASSTAGRGVSNSTSSRGRGTVNRASTSGIARGASAARGRGRA